MANPAQRLYDILLRAKTTSYANKPMIEGWREVLKINAELSDLETLSKLSKIYALPRIIAHQILRFPDLVGDEEMFLSWRKDITRAFLSMSPGNAFANFSNQISDSLLMNIRFCSRELERRMPEKVVSEDDLIAIRELAWGLYNEILGANLPSALSQYLLDQIYLIIEAIDDYDIVGATALERAINSAVGAVWTNPEMAEEVKQSSFGARFYDLISKAAAALKVVNTAADLVDKVRKMLPEH